ncbi:MAG: Glu-tRNA(Gln) amidotransferase subunit GatE [Planctomycetota bacterium]
MALPFKPLSQMTPEDYADIGLRCGLEIHQQLLTERKLFCRCPAGRYSEEYYAEILRHMRPSLSELGEYDGTALMEKKTKKNIYYRIHQDTVCTYEMDDTPPFFMDEWALDIALEIALLLRLNMVAELHIARKQYLDGSIPTGFQRTTIIGVDGWIPYEGRRIGIRQLGLEEDACREVSDVGHDRVYLTDRLGMPLVETVTEPDMRTPQETAEVAQVIRLLCRSTGKVRTGYGAAREDVNVSVAGGTRVEIKGVPQISRIPVLIYNEAMRQCSLLRIRGLLQERGVTPETFTCSVQEVTRAVAKTDYEPIRRALEVGHRVKCVCLKGFAGILNEPTQEHTIFAKEFSDRVRVIACLTQLPNMIHSDTASDYLAGRTWKDVRRKLKGDALDEFVLVWGSEEDTTTACNEIALRAREAAVGVPNDTRQALKDGTNGFERVLPGAERMYPDTDLPPIEIEEGRLQQVAARLPEFVWDRQARYRKMGLPEDVLEPLCTSPRAGVFQRIVDELKVDPVFAAVVLFQRLKAMCRADLHPERLTDEELFEVFKAHMDGRLTREGLPRVIVHLFKHPAGVCDSPAGRVAAALRALRLAPLPIEEVPARTAAVIDRLDDAAFATPQKKYRYAMGQLMRELSGRVEGQRVATLVRAQLQAVGWVESAVGGRNPP